MDVPSQILDRISDGLEELLKNTDVIEIKINDIDIFPFGLVCAKVESNPDLSELHKKIVELVSPLKENCSCKDYFQSHRSYNSEQENNLKLYGNPYVLNQFQPRITLGQVKKLNTLPEVLKDSQSIWHPQAYSLNNVQPVIQEGNNYSLVKDVLLGQF